MTPNTSQVRIFIGENMEYCQDSCTEIVFQEAHHIDLQC